MATTDISKTPKNLSVLFPDVLRRFWEDDTDRSPDTYIKKKQFGYFWDSRDVVDQKK